jgi:hypothetical protein
MPQLKRHPPGHQNRDPLLKLLTLHRVFEPAHPTPPSDHNKRPHTILLLGPPSRQPDVTDLLLTSAPTEDGLKAREVVFDLGLEIWFRGGWKGAVDEFDERWTVGSKEEAMSLTAFSKAWKGVEVKRSLGAWTEGHSAVI